MRAELVVRVEPGRPVGESLVARPLDARPAGQLGVAHAAVVARPPARALAPGIEGTLGVTPLDQRGAVLVAEIHPAGEVEEDVEVGLRLAGGFDGFMTDVNGAVGVGERAGLLA